MIGSITDIVAITDVEVPSLDGLNLDLNWILDNKIIMILPFRY